MCGIAGFVNLNKSKFHEDSGNLLASMISTLSHRGPDDMGQWEERESGIGLGHRRLSILDLSHEGHQPMESSCGRYVIVFNGEIYNHRSIREELEHSISSSWRGSSDTETLLAAISKYGVRTAVEKLVGMFAFALWDKAEKTLSLVRDRIGEKPLYYGWSNEVFLLGSELKALRIHPAFNNQINREAVGLFLRYGYIPCPYTIYRHIFKLPPGSILQLPCHGERRDPIINSYWSVKSAVIEGMANPFLGTEKEAVRQLEELLVAAIGRQMVADVPLGAFLSGGIDSSLVVALMQIQSHRPVKTFSIGFKELDFDEAPYAKAVASHLGTEHTELYISPNETTAIVPGLAQIYDEPFSDPSQIPTYLLAKLARRHVAVSLSGDGGDELFGGYLRYTLAANLWRHVHLLPSYIRILLQKFFTSIPTRLLSVGIDSFSFIMPSRIRHHNILDKLLKVTALLEADSLQELYKSLVVCWKNLEEVVPGFQGTKFWAEDSANSLALLDAIPWMMYNDTLSYLPDDILVKVDRASMAVSLESRIPLLDHRVVEFSWRLPLNFKLREGKGKWILRQILQKYVPQALIDRPKMGFGVPLDSWLRGPLREWSYDLLTEPVIKRQGLLEPRVILRKLDEHQSGLRNWQYQLWNVLMLQEWLWAQEHNEKPVIPDTADGLV